MFTVKYLRWSLLLKDVVGCIPKTLLKQYSTAGALFNKVSGKQPVDFAK